jgi:radical SAM superfamily enzyme YgiQ (UPF0313 family)
VKILLSSICLESGTDIQLALYYLKSFLLQRSSSKPRQHDVLIEVFNENLNVLTISKKILAQKAQVAGFSCYLWNIDATLGVCRLLKKRDPSLVIVLGGPEVSPVAAEVLKAEPAVDIVVRGEGEATFSAIIDRLSSRSFDLSGLAGITFRINGQVITNPDRPQMSNIGSIPSPYLTGLIDLTGKDIVDVPLETSRGCSYRCSYCFYHKNFPRVRFFPFARVEKELKYILAKKPREVYLMDATFNAYPERAKKILRFFIKYNRCSNLHVELKAELIDDEMARLLAAARANNIEIGVQSTNVKTLSAVDRKFSKTEFEAGIRLLNKYKILYEIQLIDALPYQSYDDLKKSLDWLYSIHPVKVVIFRCSVLPGTALRQSAHRYGIRYQKDAPYYAAETRHMSRQDIERAECLRVAMERLYDSQVFQKTLYELKDRSGIRISEVLEDWIDWSAGLPRAGRITPEGYNRRLPGFHAYVCRKHKLKKSVSDTN